MASTISAGTTAGTALNMTGDTTGNLAFQTGAGANTITVPNGTGTMAVQGVSTNIVSGTAVASTSGTSIDFTSIPSWVKRITVMFRSVSTSGSSNYLIQLGTSSGPTTSGYLGTSTLSSNGGNNSVNMSTGFLLNQSGQGATCVFQGLLTICLLGSNIWVASGYFGESDDTRGCTAGGSVGLAATLDRVRITTVNGTDTFDAGSINILYE
jgi:hypothetical protein